MEEEGQEECCQIINEVIFSTHNSTAKIKHILWKKVLWMRILNLRTAAGGVKASKATTEVFTHEPSSLRGRAAFSRKNTARTLTPAIPPQLR